MTNTYIKKFNEISDFISNLKIQGLSYKDMNFSLDQEATINLMSTSMGVDHDIATFPITWIAVNGSGILVVKDKDEWNEFLKAMFLKGNEIATIEYVLRSTLDNAKTDEEINAIDIQAILTPKTDESIDTEETE